MALVTRSADASIDATSAMYAPQVADLLAGEDIDMAAPCYIASADGLVYMSDATANNEAAEFVGFSASPASNGQPVTLFGLGARFRYGSGLTPGAVLFVAATAGRLDDAATTGDSVGTVQVLSDTDIRVTRVNPLGG